MYNGIYEKERFAYLYHPLEKWLQLRLKGDSLGKNLARSGVRSVAIYGAAGLGKAVLEDLTDSPVKVSCLIDRRAADYPNGMNGIPVMDIAQYSVSQEAGIVLVTPEFAFRQIMEALTAAGVPMDRIISLAMALEESGGNENEKLAGITG